MLPPMDERRERRTAGGTRKVLFGLFLVMLLGVAVYLRLWTIDYSLSADDQEILRKQFDLANREAMDESAEWRRKFDEEAEKASKCEKELLKSKEQSKESFAKDCNSSVNLQLKTLQKENMALLKQIETLRQELEAEKLKCHS